MIELLLTILVLGIISYRITRFLVLDTLIGMGSEERVVDGQVVDVPFSEWGALIYRWAYFTENTAEHQAGDDRGFIRGKIGDLVGCVYCTGFWVSVGVLALWTWTVPWQASNPTQWILTAFGVAGVQAFLNSREDG